jgi:hypothetical protein
MYGPAPVSVGKYAQIFIDNLVNLLAQKTFWCVFEKYVGSSHEHQFSRNQGARLVSWVVLRLTAPVTWNSLSVAHELWVRASPTGALNLGAVKALYSTLYPCFVREGIFTSSRSSKPWSCKNLYLFLRATDTARSFRRGRYSARHNAFAPSCILQRGIERLLEHNFTPAR